PGFAADAALYTRATMSGHALARAAWFACASAAALAAVRPGVFGGPLALLLAASALALVPGAWLARRRVPAGVRAMRPARVPAPRRRAARRAGRRTRRASPRPARPPTHTRTTPRVPTRGRSSWPSCRVPRPLRTPEGAPMAHADREARLPATVWWLLAIGAAALAYAHVRITGVGPDAA